MWEDIKNWVAVAASHIREQKDLFVHKLILVNYGNSRDVSWARIGESYFKAYKEGRITDIPDDAIAAELDSLLRVEEEMERTRKDLEDIRSRYAAQRMSIMGDRYRVWRRAGESYSAGRKKEGASRPRTVGGPGDSPRGS